MTFLTLAQTFQELEDTSKRLEKTAILKKYLKETSQLEESILLLQGLVFPAWSDKKLGMANKSLLKLISAAYGISESEVQQTFNEQGDVGLVAKELSQKKKQTTLAGFGAKPELTITKVFSNLQKIASEEGASSTRRKAGLVIELLTDASEIESKYIIRLTSGDLRIGISTGTIRDAIQQVYLPNITNLNETDDKGVELSIEEAKQTTETNITLPSYEDARVVYKYYSDTLQAGIDKINDLGEVAKIASEKGIIGLTQITITPLIPCRVMLMQKVRSVDEGIEKIPLPCALEYKYDGFRGIVHKKGSEIKIFTRSLEDVSPQFPELIERFQKDILVDEAIIDGEILGLKEDGSYVPFQEVSQRIKRKHNIHEMIKKLPVAYVTWDILYKEGKELLDLPMKERREILEETISGDDKFHLSEQIILETKEQGEAFYKESLGAGNEGVVIKDLMGTYQPGNRVGCWLKLKPIMDPLDVVVVGAEWGEGKRASWLTSFTIAIKKDDEFVTIGKVGTGFKELIQEDGVTFSQMTELLKPLIIKEDKGSVEIKPEVIITVHYEEIQKSTTYNSGFALRFPRMLSLREDLDLHEIDDLDKVTEYFSQQ